MDDLRTRLETALAEVAIEAKIVMQLVMEGKVGINQKINENTLFDARVHDQIDVKTENLSIISLLVNDYIIYIEKGRRAGAKMPPFNAILNWAYRKGLPTENKVIWAICKAIQRDGIKPRPVVFNWYRECDEFIDEWTNRLMQEIWEELDAMFPN